MPINPNKKYKFVDKDLVNGFVVLTGKELNAILEKSYKEHMEKKKWNLKKLEKKESVIHVNLS